METREQYKVGEIVFTTDSRESRDIPTFPPTPWFERTPTGLRQLRQGKPPEPNLELLGLELTGTYDEFRIQVGDWANLVKTHYGDNAYERLKAVTGLDQRATTIEDWAYTARNVAYEYRHPELSIGFWRCVAPLESTDQWDWQVKCVEEKWTVAQFKVALQQNGEVEAPEEHPAYESDRLFEVEQELHNLEIKYQEAQTEIQQYRRREQPFVADLRRLYEVADTAAPDELRREVKLTIGRILAELDTET